MKRIITFILILGSAIEVSGQNLSLNLKVGETYYQNTSSNIQIKQEVQGQSMKIDMTVSSKLGFLVKEIQDDNYLLDAHYNSLAMKTSSPFGNMDISTEKASDPKDMMSNVISKMLNNSFEILMKKDGSIEKINNLEEMFSHVFDDYPDVSQLQKAQIINQLKQSYGENSFRGNIEIVTAIFPDKDVKVNDTWTNQISIESNIRVIMDSKYTLKELADDYAVISVVAKSETSDSGEFEEINGMPTKFNLGGEMSGTIRIDRQTGWIEKSDFHQEFKGDVEIGDNPSIPGGMKIPMEMISDTMITDQ